MKTIQIKNQQMFLDKNKCEKSLIPYKRSIRNIQIIFIFQDMEQQFIVPDKSPNDQREYQAFQLPNQLKLLLICDPKAEKAACSVTVNIGSLSDGQRSLGLAHFLQHMLFMGSRKFTRHNQYSQFMSLNSGYDNAYTSDDQTNYHFEIANAKFQQAVERLCDFFVKALLTDSCIEKERQAVHEECMLRCGEDNSRKWQILKHLANGPYHNHSIGNNNTLSHPAVGEDLNNFYNNQYSANRISAVLLSALPIAEVKAKLIPLFEEIQNKKLPEIDYDLHFLTGKIGKFIKMQSIKDEVIMQFFWAVESTRPFYKWHPERYITHVLGHQGKNSLLSLLKQKDWTSKIVSYSHDLPRQTLFGLQVQLTQKGEEQYEKVYNFVVNYIENLKAEKHTYEEIKEASEVGFKYKQKGSNIHYVTELSSSMHRISLPEILSYKYRYAEFDGEVINRFLRQLVSTNLVIVYSNSEQLENPITEKHLGGKFVVNELPSYKKLATNFLPLVKNPFLPLSTDLLKAQHLVPTYQQGIWFVQGDFGVSKGGIHLTVHRNQSQIFLEFYSNYIDLLLKEITYEAESLKLQIQIQSDDTFSISIYGFSHTVQRLLEEIAPLISKAHKSQHGQQLFHLAIQDLQEQYHNFYQGDADETADQLLQILMKSAGTTVQNRIKQLEAYDYKNVSQRIDKFWKTARLQWVVVGNFQKQSIKKLLKNFQQQVGTDSSSPLFQNKCLKLKPKESLLNITQLQSAQIATSAVIMYKQIGLYSELKFYVLSLLKNYIEQPFFDKLRTQKQLAYYLRASQRNIRGVLSLIFLLVSSNSDPYQISGHISTFVGEFLAAMETDLTEQKFQMLKKSLISKTMQPFNSLYDYFEFVCRQVNRGTYCFDRKTNLVQLNDYLSQIKRQDIIKTLRQCLQYNLEVWVVAQPHKTAFQDRKIVGQDPQSIKAIHQYYEDITVKGVNKG